MYYQRFWSMRIKSSFFYVCLFIFSRVLFQVSHQLTSIKKFVFHIEKTILATYLGKKIPLPSLSLALLSMVFFLARKENISLTKYTFHLLPQPLASISNHSTLMFQIFQRLLFDVLVFSWQRLQGETVIFVKKNKKNYRVDVIIPKGV